MKTKSIKNLKPYNNNARTHSEKQIGQIARSIKQFGFNNPVLIDENNAIIAGHGRVLAAKKLGLAEVPVVMIEHLSEAQKKAYIIADNRLSEKAGWDKDILAIEFQNLMTMNVDFDLTLTGFETPEIDLMLHKEEKQPDDIDLFAPEKAPERVSLGDVWQLGRHLLICGNALEEGSYQNLLGKEQANIVITDPPYNVKINGHVCGKGKTKHSEFAMASGEMAKAEFVEFLQTAIKHMLKFSKDGSLHYIFMDWRHLEELLIAGKAYSELKNICVWNKMSGGMGSLYRSQHEFIGVFKNGDKPHTNNIELGMHGRYRTNVWDYPGIFINNKLNKENIKLHPTVKPVGLIADAILDASGRGDIVLDPFGGSGSTLLAAERTGRTARIIEISPKYCDVILYRFEQMTGIKPELTM